MDLPLGGGLGEVRVRCQPGRGRLFADRDHERGRDRGAVEEVNFVEISCLQLGVSG